MMKRHSRVKIKVKNENLKKISERKPEWKYWWDKKKKSKSSQE